MQGVFIERGIAAGQPEDRCVYKKCSRNHVVVKGEYMVDMSVGPFGIKGTYRLHEACYKQLRKSLRRN